VGEADIIIVGLHETICIEERGLERDLFNWRRRAMGGQMQRQIRPACDACRPDETPGS